MYARTTLFEVDTLRISLEKAEDIFDKQIAPLIESQPGFLGLYVMLTPEGKGMVLTLWQSEQAAQIGIESGYYEEQVSKLVTFMRQPPGREHYEVIRAHVQPDAFASSGP